MSKMIRKTLSLVLALSLVYLMSASAFADDSFVKVKDYNDGIHYVEFSAYICDAYLSADASLTSLNTGEVTASAHYTYISSDGSHSDYTSVDDLSYASIYAEAPLHAFMSSATCDFYAGFPLNGDWETYSQTEIVLDN